MMISKQLEALAIEHKAYIRGDSRFQREARVLQSLWREQQNYQAGESNGRPLGSRLQMPIAEEALLNYLNDTIREVVRSEVVKANKSAGQVYGYPRIFNNLLSSQPLCFNLFAELQRNVDLATLVFKELLPQRIGNVTGIEFEYSPGRGNIRYTNDKSAFDVYVTFQSLDNEPGFIGIEVKYHEPMRDQPAGYKARYDEIAGDMKCFGLVEKLAVLRTSSLQQIWREHLLVGSLLQRDRFTDGLFVVLYPKGNSVCAQAVEFYRGYLTDCTTFTAWTLEEMCAAVKKHTQSKWINEFEDRYLNFDKLERCVEVLSGTIPDAVTSFNPTRKPRFS